MNSARVVQYDWNEFAWAYMAIKDPPAHPVLLGQKGEGLTD